MRASSPHSSWRTQLLRFGISAVLLIFLGRLFYLQVWEHERFTVLAGQQHAATLKIHARRGEIVSADRFPLATSQEAYLVYAVPPRVEDRERTALELARVLVAEEFSQEKQRLARLKSADFGERIIDLGVKSDAALTEPDSLVLTKEAIQKEKARLIDLLTQPDRLWVPIAHQLSVAGRDQIAGLKLPGIYFEMELERAYPEGTLASHVLGFVGKNEVGEDWGYYGLEGYYQGDLAGKDGSIEFEKDVSGQPIPISATKRQSPVNGRTLILSLRRNLQYLLEKKLAVGVERYGAKNGTVIVLDPSTGEVLVMANYPNYDPQYWGAFLAGETDVSKVEIFRNLAISQNYEPGSVFKGVTMSAALQSKKVTPETKFNDTGPLTFSGYEVETWDGKYHGEIGMAQILQLSNNTGAAWLAHRMGQNVFARFLDRFQLGQASGIDLEGEDSGIIRDKKEWRDIDLANMAFGQGIATTPLQLLNVYSAIANGGRLLRPHLVKEIIREDGSHVRFVPEQLFSPIDEQTAYTIQEMLQSVIDRGEFKWFVQQSGLNHFDLAGKTGTAQIPEGGHYNPYKTQVTFVGLAPTHGAQFVMLVKLSEPTASTYSADTAVPLWLEMAKDVLVYFNIAPTR